MVWLIGWRSGMVGVGWGGVGWGGVVEMDGGVEWGGVVERMVKWGG